MENTPEKLARPVAQGLDEILGHAFRVLDDGFVRVIDYMGDDRAIVQAARVSYGDGTKKTSEDRGLIRYLIRHRHTTPFEMCEIKLHLRVPMHTWRQWIRHRTASVNEYSTRYSIAIDAAQKTAPEEWRLQAVFNRQGSDGLLEADTGAELSLREDRLLKTCRQEYLYRLEQGVAREQARKDLPLSTYTEAYWKMDLHNLLRFLALRMDGMSQAEIRAYAEIIGNEIVSRWCPLTWEAFLDYRLNALHLSRIETDIIAAAGAGDAALGVKLAERAGLLVRDEEGTLKRSRERSELEEKLARLNLPVPWTDSGGK